MTQLEMQAIKNARLKDFELYYLHKDPSESQDRSDAEPAVLKRLEKQMQAIYRSVQKEGPVWPDWKWPRYESERIIWPDYWLNRKKR